MVSPNPTSVFAEKEPPGLRRRGLTIHWDPTAPREAMPWPGVAQVLVPSCLGSLKVSWIAHCHLPQLLAWDGAGVAAGPSLAPHICVETPLFLSLAAGQPPFLHLQGYGEDYRGDMGPLPCSSPGGSLPPQRNMGFRTEGFLHCRPKGQGSGRQTRGKSMGELQWGSCQLSQQGLGAARTHRPGCPPGLHFR